MILARSDRNFVGASALLFAASAVMTIVWCKSMSAMGGIVSQALLFTVRGPLVSLLRVLLARHVADSTAMEQFCRAI